MARVIASSATLAVVTFASRILAVVTLLSKIFAVVTFASAILAVVTLESVILAVVTALSCNSAVAIPASLTVIAPELAAKLSELNEAAPLADVEASAKLIVLRDCFVNS